jgi:predicted DNA-binding transcriptional regulator AlpA
MTTPLQPIAEMASGNAMNSPLLDTRAAALRLGLARQTLAKMRITGDGPRFLKLGSRVFYPSDELDAWIASHPLRRSTSQAA